MRQLLPFAFLLILTACSSSPFQKSDHFDGQEFFNPGVQTNKSFFQFLKWQMTSQKQVWPEWVDDNATPQLADKVEVGQTVITLINHSTYLIQLPGLNVLTDPIFSERSSPVSWAGPKRHRSPGLAFENLPPVHVVYISHNHYDHMDLPSIRRLVQTHDPVIVTPLGNKKILEKAGARKVVELDWWQSTTLPGGAILHMAQVQHWSARTLFDTNESLWGGFVLQANRLQIYFGGDSGYGPHYQETFKRFGAMDVSLLPIGAYEPRWFMKEQHLNPDDAVKAHLDLRSRLSLGIHYGTFQLADEGISTPLEDLQASLRNRQVSVAEFLALKNGETKVYLRSSR